jgi:hypothetical protein
MNRDNVLSRAVDECLKELYSYVQPAVSWSDFKYQNEIYSSKYRSWEEYRKLLRKKEEENLSKEELEKFSIFPVNWKNKSKTECIGPAPYEFYFLPKEIMKDVCDSYVYAYKMDNQQELLDTIEILKNYCKEPIVDKYIEGENGFPGHKGYDHPNNLEKELIEICSQHLHEPVNMAKELQNKFFEFLDMAGNFFNWNRDLNSFSMSVYLGPSPNSNKEAVINNWKKYRNQDIEIDEEQIKKDYYGEDELD